MKDKLWSANTPEKFWCCMPDFSEEVWSEATRRALPVLGLSFQDRDIEAVLELTLGEAQFGEHNWQLSRDKRLYYLVKPYLPRFVIEKIKLLNSHIVKNNYRLGWPIEKRYVMFQWEVMRQLMIISGQSSITFRGFWPEGKRFSLVLTHDIETADGQNYVRKLVDIEENLGFRSSFNFVPESYPLDYKLMDELRNRGFEIGVHGLKHDGRLFSTHDEFTKRYSRINHYLDEFDAVGFRAPLMHRNPAWLQSLMVEYDLSFFDTDPYEPMPGGCMSIWPYFLGRFVELPYTLAQDSTLGTVLGERTPQIWLDKLDFIESYHGMALVNTHPDYLRDFNIMNIYQVFLRKVRKRDDYWHALPNEVARWWRVRGVNSTENAEYKFTISTANLENDHVIIQ